MDAIHSTMCLNYFLVEVFSKDFNTRLHGIGNEKYDGEYKQKVFFNLSNQKINTYQIQDLECFYNYKVHKCLYFMLIQFYYFFQCSFICFLSIKFCYIDIFFPKKFSFKLPLLELVLRFYILFVVIQHLMNQAESINCILNMDSTKIKFCYTNEFLAAVYT